MDAELYEGCTQGDDSRLLSTANHARPLAKQHRAEQSRPLLEVKTAAFDVDSLREVLATPSDTFLHTRAEWDSGPSGHGSLRAATRGAVLSLELSPRSSSWALCRHCPH